MTYKMYGIPNCNSVKKAKDFLQLHNVEFTFHDYKKSGISAEKLDAWTTQLGWERILNKVGTTWRGLSDQEKASIVDAESAKEMMLLKSSLIKRPLIEQEDGKVVLLGFNVSDYEQQFAQ